MVEGQGAALTPCAALRHGWRQGAAAIGTPVAVLFLYTKIQYLYTAKKRAQTMARKKGWLGRISKYLIGGNMAMMFDVYYDMEEDVDKPYRAIEWYFSIAGTTCVELLYKQVGQHKFDPTDRMDTPVYLRVTAADLPELAKTIPRLGPSDLIWLDRPVRGIDDIRQIQDELKMRSVFKDDPPCSTGRAGCTTCATTMCTGPEPCGAQGE